MLRVSRCRRHAWCAHLCACNLQVVGALARVMGHTVRERVEWQTPVVVRLMQGTLHALTQLVAHMAPVAQALSCRCLKGLIFNLLSSLLHPRVASQGVGESGEALKGLVKADEAAKQMLASMNALLMHALKRAQANRVLSVLIRFLYERPAERSQEDGDEGEDEGEMVQALSPELVEAVLKCLLEMARRMRTYLAHLDIDLLLLDIHQFLTYHPPSRYRGQEFKPLRLLKTIINELVKQRGQEIRQHLTLIPVDTNPTLCTYLDLVFKQQQAEAAGSQPHPALPHHPQAPAQVRLQAAEDALPGAALRAADARTEASNERLEVLVSEEARVEAAEGTLETCRPASSTPVNVQQAAASKDATVDEAGQVQGANASLTKLSLNLPDKSAVPVAAAAAALKGPGATDMLINKYQALRSRGASSRLLPCAFIAPLPRCALVVRALVVRMRTQRAARRIAGAASLGPMLQPSVTKRVGRRDIC
jgi:hypothetical protein